MEKKHYTLEYKDDEGDLVIKHLIISPKKVDELLKTMLDKGISFNLIENSNVTFENEEKALKEIEEDQ